MAQMTLLHGDAVLMTDHTPGSAVSAGDVVVTNGLVRIAHNDIAASALGALACGGGVYSGTADGAIAIGDKVYWDDTNNKVSGTSGANVYLGVALSASAADGDAINVVHKPASGRARSVVSIPVNLASVTGAQDIVTNYTPGFAGRVVKLSAVVNVPVTTASKAAAINAEIGTTNVTGGVVSLTSANCTPMGAVVNGTAITAANSFGATDTISLEAASVTAFAEGSVTVLMVLESDA